MSDLPRPEHPRPQFHRPDWMSLNGVWRYAFDFGRSGRERGWHEKPGFNDSITVPFCPESALSGVGHTDFIESMFYARTFAMPDAWAGRRILLHFGAVEYAATVWIDGAEVGFHQGGSSSFSLDVTAFVRPGTEHTLVVHALDELRTGWQGGGKQAVAYASAGCHYTRVTGIWQSVWLESVHPEGLARCRTTPCFDAGAFTIEPSFSMEKRGHRFTAVLFVGGAEVARASGPAVNGAALTLAVPAPRAWSPADPFLYDLVFEVADAAGATLDRVHSYAGLRKIHIEGDRVYLNNESIFQRLVLDQGFYRDGVWTAPSDEALRRDIELSMAAGFNGARLHQKVFEERFHYWADKLGYLTWAEYPSWGLDWNAPEARCRFLAEWAEIVERDRNHPSIIAWSPLNETCPPNEKELAAAFAQKGSLARYRTFLENVYDLTKRLDPTRPVNDASGYLHVKTDLWTVHPYCATAESLARCLRPESGGVLVHAPRHESPYAGQPYIVDEFGGFKYIPPEARGAAGAGWGYHGLDLATPDELLAKIGEQVAVMLADPGISGYCYTQLTDVEQEENGIYTYDRASKAPEASLRAIFGRRSPHFDC